MPSDCAIKNPRLSETGVLLYKQYDQDRMRTDKYGKVGMPAASFLEVSRSFRQAVKVCGLTTSVSKEPFSMAFVFSAILVSMCHSLGVQHE
eukprot:4331671-Amphidinium_carterae.1